MSVIDILQLNKLKQRSERPFSWVIFCDKHLFIVFRTWLFEICVVRSLFRHEFHIVLEDNIKIYHKETGPEGVDWIYLAQDGDQWWVF